QAPDDARPLSRMSRQARANYRQIVEEVRQNKYRTGIEVAEQVIERVYRQSARDSGITEKIWIDWYVKNTAINLNRMVDKSIPEYQRTVEIRAVRTQRNFADFLAVIRLFKGRLNHL